MKKLIALFFALFVAMASAETYVASEKITQELLAGSLTQTVYAGDEIKLIKIKYDNIDESKHQSGNISDLGLTEKWTGSVCEISGKINGNIAAQTIKAYILVQDDEGKYAKTDLSFKVLEKPFKLEWNDGYGRMNQTVKIGYSITPIIFEYDAIEEWGVSGLPSGLVSEIDEKMHYIIVAGTVEESVESGDYEYKVTVKDYNSEEHTLSGTITVKGLTDVTSIKVIENEKQKVTAGKAIKPVVFKFEYAQDIEIKDAPPGHFGGASEDESTFIVEGTVAENTKDGNYTIKVIAKGEQSNDTAFATVEVTHNPVVTSLSVIENETQTVTAGDSIEPIVFKFENIVGFDGDGITGFPGGFKAEIDNATKTVIVFGKIQENAKGPYTVKLSVKGADNNASAEATINVTAVKLKFELAEGSDNQTVVAGEAITPIVYKYDHMLSAKGTGFPADLEVVQDKENKLIKISGTVKSGMASKEYVYSFEITDVHSEKTTVSGKINVLASTDNSSSSVASSSSSAKSSSSVEESSSSVKSSSSSKKDDKSSSSSVKSSDSKSSSSSAKTPSSSSGKNDKSSSSSAKSSSSAVQSSSSEKTIKIVTVAMNGVKFGYADNALTVALPTSSMVRVQVFDLTGHLVETFAESMTGSKSFSFAHLNRGNFLVRVESNSVVRTARIAVK